MKTRIISAVVATALVLPFIIIGGQPYAFGVGVLATLGFVEILNLKKSHQKFPKVVSIIALLGLLLVVYAHNLGYEINNGKFIFIVLSLLSPVVFYKNDKYTTLDAFYLIGSVLFLGIAFNSFILVRTAGLKTFFYLALIPICTDTFALILGLKLGKHKIAPKISPKKSWEGAVAGLAFGTVLPCIFYALCIQNFSWKIIIATMILSTVGQIGDLIFSKIKRENDIKDFSNIMPGHGGILDRLDSTIVIFMTYILLTAILF